MQGISDQESRHSALTRQPAQILDVLASSSALQGLESLSRDAKIVADGEPDALLPEVKRQYARRYAQTRPSKIRLYFPSVLGSESETVVPQTQLGEPLERAAVPTRGYASAIIAAAVVIGALYLARVVFITVAVAIITALILEPFVVLLVRVRFPRALASFVVCTVALLAVYLAGLSVYNQITGVASDAPAFKDHLAAFVGGVSDRIQALQDSTAHILMPVKKNAEQPIPPPPANVRKSRKALTPAVPTPGVIPEVRIHDDRNPVFDYIYGQLGALYQVALMASFVPLLVYFMLSWRDHVHRSFLRFFDISDRETVARTIQVVAGMARAFVVGNFMLGLVLAAVSSTMFAVIRLPYPFLVGVVSGLLSLVPYAGLVLAILPPVLAALATGAPSATLLIAGLIVIALHLVALNILYPIVVGARVHLNPLIVTLSLMFWGFLWDAAGLVLAIPITAGLKAVCDNVEGLRKYGRFLGD
jgi:predicted PurR-regulated permease PerM